MAMFSIKPNPMLEFVFSDSGAALYQVYFDGAPMLYSRDEESFESPNVEYFGQFVGPVAGRIRDGVVKGFVFEPNENDNVVHSSTLAWCWKPFTHKIEETDSNYIVSFFREDKLFGGIYRAEADYSLSKTEPSFTLKLRFTCTKDCPCNMTSHLYFSLGETDMANVTLKLQNDARMSYTASNLPIGFIEAREPYNFGEGRKLDFPLDHALHLSSPYIEAWGEKYGLKAHTNEKTVVVYVDIPSRVNTGASKGFTLEFVRYPKCDAEMILPEGQTEIVSMDYTFYKR